MRFHVEIGNRKTERTGGIGYRQGHGRPVQALASLAHNPPYAQLACNPPSCFGDAERTYERCSTEDATERPG